MVVLRMRGNGKGQGRIKNMNMNQKASILPKPKAEQMGGQTNLGFGSTDVSDMLAWLKGIALDPYQPETSKYSVHSLWNQTLKLRKVWRSDNAKYPQRKRKLEQLLKGGEFTKASRLASQNSNNQNVKKLGCEQPRSVSCLPNLAVKNSCSSCSVLTFENSFQRKQLLIDSNTSDNTSNWSSNNKDISFLIDMEESVNGSNPLSPEDLIVQDLPLADSGDLIGRSHSSSSEEKLQRMTESEGENLPRAVIPIGPGFQAEVPAWSGPVNKGNRYGCDDDTDSESLKWLGTKIWPIKEASKKSNMKVIGRGRSESCSCSSPGSEDCIKCHKVSARLDLQSDLGPAFFSWKFDEMGEVVSKAWTLKEQHLFESFVKKNPLSNAIDFWKGISKLCPSKCRKGILSYYYNVFIPRRMSQKTRSSSDQVDSDEDQIDNDDIMQT